MNWQQVDNSKILLSYLAAGLYLFINNTINALSVWSEHTRDAKPSIALWEPFVWEYTSALGALLLLPLLFMFFKRFALRFEKINQQLVVHLFGSLLFAKW
ncbi:hypothetical protein PSECIP111854_00052 [Pseudoalteromonas sp. CIP111854]|uniref:Uncharacterized protein n=1 Tax=Pseudoalteromonas holothuriae TaxID=2963714 RepID=A0A9W4QQN7_9GAMM|nr:hypothetical protein [Pseudoalteromonas sp. CIP111854]CAH9049419.1 hypothetical protein PSECIP111854_00052 [Pseudoalteromonas sp. CIP111854]